MEYLGTCKRVVSDKDNAFIDKFGWTYQYHSVFSSRTFPKKLSNDGFASNAPAEVVKSEQEKKKTTEEKIVKLEGQLKEF